MIDIIKYKNWYKLNLVFALLSSGLAYLVCWIYQDDKLLLPSTILLAFNILAIFFYLKKKEELSFYTVYTNFFIVLPIFSTAVNLSFTITALYTSLMVTAFLLIMKKKELLIIISFAIISFILFLLSNIYLPKEELLSFKKLDFILSFIVILSLVNNLIQYSALRRAQIEELDFKNSELERYIETNLELENFAFVASHDLRTPIRNIMGFSQLLKAKTTDRLLPKEVEYLDMIIDSTSYMNQLVLDLLKYSNSNEIEYEIDGINLLGLLNQVTISLSSVIEEKSASINIEIDPEHKIHGDKDMLHVVFENLLSNALLYVDKGVSPQIKVASKFINDEIHINVSDNGIGIKPEYRETVFLLLKQLQARSVNSGTGIGLSIAKKVIEKHHGNISIESNPNGGSVFNVTLPIDPMLKTKST